MQDNIRFGDSIRDLTLQAVYGIITIHLNKEFLVSPRAQLSWKPNWKKDVVFKAGGRHL